MFTTFASVEYDTHLQRNVAATLAGVHGRNDG